jgi:G10 protein
MKIADGPLIAKWRKPGYENLCSMVAIQKGNHSFGTTSLCRVPLKQRAPHQRVQPSVETGCISCSSGVDANTPAFPMCYEWLSVSYDGVFSFLRRVVQGVGSC